MTSPKGEREVAGGQGSVARRAGMESKCLDPHRINCQGEMVDQGREGLGGVRGGGGYAESMVGTRLGHLGGLLEEEEPRSTSRATNRCCLI